MLTDFKMICSDQEKAYTALTRVQPCSHVLVQVAALVLQAAASGHTAAVPDVLVQRTAAVLTEAGGGAGAETEVLRAVSRLTEAVTALGGSGKRQNEPA